MSLIKNNNEQQEYLVLISPTRQVREAVKKVKDLFAEKFKATHPLESVAHISVMNIIMDKNNENKLKEILKNFCKDQEVFNIFLSGYDGFRPHTIFIKVIEEKAITALHRRLKEAITPRLNLETWQIGTYSNPHMTVARNLTEDIYNKAIGEYRGRKFEQSFAADNLTLLWRKYMSGNKSHKWEGKQEFKFGQAQESLFG
ncbi:MAG TPA: 2'-5' RNA ligase family protein [Ignavibacteria bacterium]